ncbi:ORF1178 [White spot syndrome virus]|uniref:ORF1178 n=1 Tax=White spot syndrome virus TaxID=342409 RepID=A0A2D3I6V4_9VIRU|nr:ORF1178 [White spot syndrome virus]
MVSYLHNIQKMSHINQSISHPCRCEPFPCTWEHHMKRLCKQCSDMRAWMYMTSLRYIYYNIVHV